eukprot:TRINITY_DN1767_c0_g1_i1.p1 TRINITY_DN1767_c0_g1~~TRINITY_DN1767_c0_g1_i1.p1  ORF type:complete len:240 (+),score=67.15 TRINITY_DN1767_c0_g1_i1:126-845(+)
MSTAEEQKKASADYLQRHGIPSLLEDLTASLTRELPPDPIAFLLKKLGEHAEKSDQHVVFVLGGPGSGKGTVCARLVEEMHFVHLSAGDLLREEQSRDGSEHGELIKTFIREGKIVPKEITISLLKNAMKRHPSGTTFLIDGFPRAMDQCLMFEEQVQKCKFCLFLDCSEEAMTERLLERGKSSGRIDDNVESMKKRFRTFKEQTMPVVEYFATTSRTKIVSAAGSKDEVYGEVKKLFE